MLREEGRIIRIQGTPYNVRLLIVEERDRERIRHLYDAWRELFLGMREFRSRGINLPEGISESAFCLEYDSARVLDVQGASASFDTIDLGTGIRQQIKATSVQNDLTSFGPRSVWDDLYWLDFFRDGAYDRNFDVYRIPNELILNFQINRTETFRDQQRQGRRPRLHIRHQILIPNNIKPERTCCI